MVTLLHLELLRETPYVPSRNRRLNYVLRGVLAMARIVAPTDATVLINGVTGTG